MVSHINHTESNIIPKYYQLKKLLLNEIQSGKYSIHSKLPSESELRKKYKISGGPIKRAINELAREGIVYTIQGKGCFVSPTISKSDIKIAKDNKRIIFITNSVLHEFNAPILKGILRITQSKGYNLEVYDSEGCYSSEIQILSKLLKENISGLIFVPTYYNYSYRHLLQLKKRNVPIVLINRYIKNDDFNFVGINDVKSAKNAVKYLIKLGHKKIVFIGIENPERYTFVKDRLEGYKQALKENKIKIDPNLIFINENKKEKYKRSAKENYNFEQLKKYLSKDDIEYTSIFAVNDSAAMASYWILKEKGIKVPDEVSIIGFDDLNESKHFEVPLTTVKQDTYYIGYTAAKLLLDINNKMNNLIPKKILLNTKLVIRKSVRQIK